MVAVDRELKSLEPINISGIVRSMQLMTAKTAISGALGALWNALGDIIAAGQQDATTEALRASFEWDDVLFGMGLTTRKRAAMKASLLSAGRFNVEAMLARIYITRIPLSQQVYRTRALAEGWVEKRIDTALANGATVSDLAKDVKAFVNPTTPGGVSYAARRLARTEINAAYHAVTIVHNEGKPWNTGMRWSLSGSHPTVDVCDTYARKDQHQLGKGVFPLGDVPPKPHPQCLCYVFPETVSPERFLEEMRAGKYDDYMEATYDV